MKEILKTAFLGLCCGLLVGLLVNAVWPPIVRADYTSQAALASDVTFQARVKIAGYNAAIAITNEPSNATNHVRRASFAQAYAQNADAYVPKLAFGVAADAAITASSDDVAIQNRVNGIWDTYAGKD